MRTFLSTLILLIAVGTVNATPPRTLGYQGVLTDSMGAIVPDGSYNMTFRIYTVPSGGTPLWSETQSVTVTDGRFDVILGSVSPLTLLNFNDPYWLGLRVGLESEMTPRTELAGAPYSQIARAVEDDAITSSKIANNTVVRSLNGLDDNVNIVAGANVSVTPVGNDIQISSSAGGNPPGVASQEGITSGALSSTLGILVQQTIDCPAAGYVLVIASCHVFLNHTGGSATYVFVGTSDESASIPSNQEFIAQVPQNAGTGTYTFPLTSSGIYEVSAGMNTFYLLGRIGSSTGTASVSDRTLSLIFFDTSYGNVAPLLTFDPSLPNETAPAVDLGDRGAVSASVDRNLASEVADLRARLATLEARLRDE